MKFFAFLFLSFVTVPSSAQQEKIAALPPELREISGLERLNDSTFAAINDGGNAPRVYLINQQGVLLKSVSVSNATNADWEDLTLDTEEQYLYIGDFGNNLNQRRNLCFYRITVTDLITDTAVAATKIPFSYPDQQLFPPPKNNLLYDCEATVFYKGYLYLFGKANDKPYSGQSRVYRLSPSGGTAEYVTTFTPGKQGYFQNSITAADYLDGRFYLSSYSNIYICTFNNGHFEPVHSERYNRLTQKESLVALDAKTLLVADEKSPLFIGQNLYKIQLTHD